MMERKITFRNKKKQKIVGILAESDKSRKAVTVIIHGFSAHKNKGAKLIAATLTKSKINSLRIDLDDRGESEPKFEDTTITDYVNTTELTIAFCKRLGYKKINLLGTSTGGLVATATALKHPELDTLILRAPVSNNDKDCLDMFGKGEIRNWKRKGYATYTKSDGTELRKKYAFYTDGHKYKMFDKVKRVKIPTLIIQGTIDKEVNPNDTKRLAKGFQDARLIMIKGADHSLGVKGNYSKSMNAITEWMKQR